MASDLNVGFGSWQQRRAIETPKNRMLHFNAGVSVSLRSNDLPCHMSAEHIGQLKVGTWFAPFVVAGRFKRSEKRASVLDVLSNGFRSECGLRLLAATPCHRNP